MGENSDLEYGNLVTLKICLSPGAIAKADAFHLTEATLASSVLMGVLLGVVSMLTLNLVPIAQPLTA